VRCAATAPTTGFAVVYGVSRNSQSWWKDDDAMRIGYEPRDSADDYREELLITRPGEKPPIWQGGNVLMRDYRKPETLNISPPTPTSPDIGHDC
jgi:uronate dehydrogenase